ncbi:MAG: FG-GAP repeat protein [Anaerolineaceae bacterium]|nr:FG-GAP repeat protein [Anaerolineaceae bacterium]
MQKCGRFPFVVLLVCMAAAWLMAAHLSPAVVPGVTAQTDTINFPQWYFESDQAAASLGFAASGAGDVNGDGFEDILVGAPKYSGAVHKAGTVLAFYGSASGLQPGPQWRFDGDQTGAELGFAVAAAGDVNDDGFDDVLLSAPRYNQDHTREGRVYAFYGAPGGLPPTPDWQVESNLVEAYLGWSVAGAGDVNNDGFADVIIGAKWAQQNFFNEGMVQLYLGSAAGLENLPAWTVYGGQAGASLGTAVSSAGDINHDGFADVLVGVPLFDASEEDAGRVLAFCGLVAGLAQTPCWSVTGMQQNGRLGEAVSGGGDVTGDGLDDVVIGAPGQNATVPEAGAVFLFGGSAAGLSTESWWTAVANQSFAHFGAAVNMHHDLNGDSLHDVLVGAYTYSADQSQEGRLYAFYGALGGPGAQPDWIAEGNKAEAEFGFALGSSDVDGDGQAEVLAGAPNYRKETELRGRIFLFEPVPGGTAVDELFLPLVLKN